MIFRRSKKTVKKGMWGMDKLVTGIIIWGAAASIFGLSRTKKWKKFWTRAADMGEETAKKWVTLFWKTTVKCIDFLKRK